VRDCGSGVSLRVSAGASGAVQGSLLRVEVRSAKALTDVKGEWNGHALVFWQDVAPAAKAVPTAKTSSSATTRATSSSAANGADVRHALLGIDLETPPGAHDVTVEGQLTDGERAACSASVAVKDGKFAIEKLQVAQEFVEPNPEEEERAVREGQRLHEIYARVTPERLWSGTFRMPLAGAHTARNFGRRRVLNGEPRSPHTGVDMPAPTGTPVHAAQRGRVVLAENLFYAGNAVVIDHGLGVYTLYAHLSAIAVKEGDAVERGALIGKVGATGRVTGPHLHWGLIVNEARVNALQIVGVPLG